jgi:hypothetical protein
MTDILARAEPFLNQCGSCAADLPAACTRTAADFRPVMLDLVREVERLRAELDRRERNRIHINHAEPERVIIPVPVDPRTGRMLR